VGTHGAIALSHCVFFINRFVNSVKASTVIAVEYLERAVQRKNNDFFYGFQ